jgi:hypothetical protein
MNMEKKIQRCLKAAPKPPAPDDFLDKLEKDVAPGDIKMRCSALRRWFAPTNGSISPWRVAAAAVIAIAVLLPLSYGAVKAVKHLIFEDKVSFEYPEDNAVYTVKRSISVVGGDGTNNEEDARKKLEEFKKLYREGHAKEIEPGVWKATLSNGEEFAYAGDPERISVEFTEEEKEQLKKQFDEINELKRAGKYERTFIKDIEVDGIKISLYKDCFTLSNGKVITLTTGENKPATDEVE